MAKVNESVIGLVDKIEGYKTCLKTVHWNAVSLSEHRLCDDVQDKLGEFEDTIAELAQAIAGERIAETDLVPQRQSADNLEDFLNKLLIDVEKFYEDVVPLGLEWVGVSSETETFIGDVQKFIYQASFCKKED